MAFPREILDDKTKYPDDKKITLDNGVEVTMGDLRAFQAEQDGALQERMAAVTAQQAQLNALSEELAQYRARLEAQPPNPASPDPKSVADQLLAALRNGDAKIDIFKEPGDYFKPLVEKLTAIESWKADQEAKLAADRAEMNKALVWAGRRFLRSEYKAAGQWPKELNTWEKAAKYAADNNLIDEYKYPDFDAAHERVTAPARDEARIKQIRDEAKAEGAREAEQNLRTKNAFVPLPGGNGAGMNGVAPKRFGGIEKVPDADILNDPDIIAAFTQNGNG